MKLGEKCIIRNAVISGIIGVLGGLLPVWVYASVGERIYLALLIWVATFVALTDSDPTLKKLTEIRDREEVRKSMKPKRVK